MTDKLAYSNDNQIDSLLRLSDVERVTALGRSTIYRKIAAKAFPRPYTLSTACVRWRESEIKAWLAALRRTDTRAA